MGRGYCNPGNMLGTGNKHIIRMDKYGTFPSWFPMEEKPNVSNVHGKWSKSGNLARKMDKYGCFCEQDCQFWPLSHPYYLIGNAVVMACQTMLAMMKVSICGT